jgi:hypothetical protein
MAQKFPSLPCNVMLAVLTTYFIGAFLQNFYISWCQGGTLTSCNGDGNLSYSLKCAVCNRQWNDFTKWPSKLNPTKNPLTFWTRGLVIRRSRSVWPMESFGKDCGTVEKDYLQVWSFYWFRPCCWGKMYYTDYRLSCCSLSPLKVLPET